MTVRTRLALDAVLTLGFALALSPARTGLSVHEWLSVAILVAVLVHVVINWEWVTRVAGSLFQKVRATSVVNWLVDGLLFITTVAVTLSGLLVSQVIASTLGLAPTANLAWHTVHSMTANMTMALLLVHLALHAPLIGRLITRSFRTPAGEVTA